MNTTNQVDGDAVMTVTVRDYAVNEAGTAFVTRIVSVSGQIMAHGRIHNAQESADHLARALAWLAKNHPEWRVRS